MIEGQIDSEAGEMKEDSMTQEERAEILVGHSYRIP